jgi:5-methylcytosine-specific restriction endonuclease McrA
MENDLDFTFDFTPDSQLSQKPAAVRKRRWRTHNPERARLQWRIDRNNQRARQMGCEGVLTISEWLMICSLYGSRCLRCGLITELEIDHVQSLYCGGENTRENVQPLCASCNKFKGRQSIDYRAAQAVQGGAVLS